MNEIKDTIIDAIAVHILKPTGRGLSHRPDNLEEEIKSILNNPFPQKGCRSCGFRGPQWMFRRFSQVEYDTLCGLCGKYGSDECESCPTRLPFSDECPSCGQWVTGRITGHTCFGNQGDVLRAIRKNFWSGDLEEKARDASNQRFYWSRDPEWMRK